MSTFEFVVLRKLKQFVIEAERLFRSFHFVLFDHFQKSVLRLSTIVRFAQYICLVCLGWASIVFKVVRAFRDRTVAKSLIVFKVRSVRTVDCRVGFECFVEE